MYGKEHATIRASISMPFFYFPPSFLPFFFLFLYVALDKCILFPYTVKTSCKVVFFKAHRRKKKNEKNFIMRFSIFGSAVYEMVICIIYTQNDDSMNYTYSKMACEKNTLILPFYFLFIYFFSFSIIG